MGKAMSGSKMSGSQAMSGSKMSGSKAMSGSKVSGSQAPGSKVSGSAAKNSGSKGGGQEIPKDQLETLKKETKFQEAEIRGMYAQFIDEYPEGYISQEKFQNAAEGAFPKGDGRKLVEIVFNSFDQNQDGKIDYCELMKTLNVAKHGSEDDRMRFVFGVFDLDKDGYMRKDEMQKFLLAMMMATGQTEDNKAKGSKGGSQAKNSKGAGGSSGAPPQEDQLSPEDAEKAAKVATELIFAEMDDNDDAKISFEEFK